MIPYELIIPSASRPHLLGRVLESLVQHLDQPPARLLVHDDAVFPGKAAEVEAAVWAATRDMLGYTIFLGFIGWTMIASGRGSQERTRVRAALARGRARDAMRAPPPVVPADLSLSEALDHYLRGREREHFPVIDGSGRVIGLVSFESARRIGARDPLRPVRDATRPLSTLPVIDPDDALDRVLTALGRGRTGLVMRDGRLLGAIGTQDIAAWYERVKARPSAEASKK